MGVCSIQAYVLYICICIYMSYVYCICICLCDICICMICTIWMLIHVSYGCLDFIASVGSYFRLGGVGSVLIKVRGNLSVV